ncbi:MAG: DASS family sodium-coupled anion symporter [Campylobacterota bacterium]|nr:DASS family sodium-coupled anion symporter [Campylobacterota bacterium]
MQPEALAQTKKIGLGLVLALIAFLAMMPFFTIPQSLLVASIVLLVTLWTNEGVPLGVVSLLPIILFPSFGILSTAETTANYAKPIIYLFLGGFLLAIAVEKTDLHRWIANKILGLFPNTARGIIFALIITSGLLSSVLSNTTTTLLLLPIALFLSEDNRLKLRFALGIAYGASVGGILTPIGTPPNLILMGIMEEHGMEAIPFVQWMWMVAPLVIVMFVIVGVILSMGLKDLHIDPDLDTPPLDPAQKKVMYLLMGVIFLLFINAPIKPFYSGLGLSEPGILLGAGLLLFAPPFSILEWTEDKAKIAFRIMFLFGAGFAIAMAFTKTGMADEVASYLVALTTLPVILFMLAVAALVTFTTEITSNTALISIMLPILYSVTLKTGLDSTLFMMVATVCASYAFMLPIATPPNAIAMSSGVVDVKTMAKYGVVLNIIGILSIVLVGQLLWKHVL